MADYTHFHFVHIPKCGGTSFREYLNKASLRGGVAPSKIYIPGLNNLKTARNYNQLNFIQRFVFKKKPYTVIGMHAELDIFQAKTGLDDKPFKYTILRNPVDRFLSHYYHFYFHQDADGCKEVHLADLKESKRQNLIKHTANLMIKYLSSRGLKSEIYKADLNEAKTKLATLSSYGILEQMEYSMHLLKEISPKWLTFDEPMPLRNKKRVPFLIKEVVPASIREEIEFYNQYDLELYNYALESFNK